MIFILQSSVKCFTEKSSVLCNLLLEINNYSTVKFLFVDRVISVKEFLLAVPDFNSWMWKKFLPKRENMSKVGI